MDLQETTRQIEARDALLNVMFDQLDRAVRAQLDFQTCSSTQDILVSGSGDSYAAGLSMEMHMSQHARVPCRPMNSMTTSRYLIPFLSEARARRSLLISISNSGGTARVVEGQRLARLSKVTTLAITSNVKSELGTSAELSVDISLDESLPSGHPSILPFLACQLTLALIGIRIGEAAGRVDSMDALAARGKIRASMNSFAEFLQSAEETVGKLAKEYKDCSTFEVLGSGPNYGSAMYTAAKFIEVVGLTANALDVEEFQHVQFFEKQRPLPTILFAGFGNSYSRAVEIAHEVRKLERPLIAVVQEGETEIAKIANHVIHAPADLSEDLSPLVFPLVGELIAAKLADLVGETPFRGFRGFWKGDALPTSGVRTSQQVSSYQELPLALNTSQGDG
jgi:glucosamine--fructose-6-phosphate aminotransferase (isomerizing)